MTSSPTYSRYVALGDSFTEGVGDDLPDGRQRGWADFVALGLQASANEPVGYANLAIRGRKLGQIIAEQLEPALALDPDLMTFNGGGNDIMRPRVSIGWVVDETVKVVHRALEKPGLHVVVLAGANPSRHLPMGGLMQRRGDALADAVLGALRPTPVTLVNNWADETLTQGRYWSVDKLHLNALGHARVASNVLTALGVPVPGEWGVEEVAAAGPGTRSRNTAAYYREFVLPWVGRRVTGRSSGDGREPKRATLLPVD
jgi:lysophospholipase L1-like esterase